MRTVFVVGLVAALCLGTVGSAVAACSCPSGGVPRLLRASMRGNDLNQVSGDCVVPGESVELQVRQQRFHRKSPLPVHGDGPFEGSCINDCEWITIASTTSDPLTGQFRFENLDQQHSVQLLSPIWSRQGFDGIRTDLRARTWDPQASAWTTWTEPPALEAFALRWPDKAEGIVAAVETRVTGAHRMHVTIADGPDDGDEPTVQLDVDTDTPNFWLDQQSGDATVVYHRSGECRPQYAACRPEWLVQLAPSITVDAPAFQAHTEYPFVLGMATATRPGTMMFATSVLGPRNTADFSVDVDVDVNVEVVIDLDLGLDFFSIF